MFKYVELERLGELIAELATPLGTESVEVNEAVGRFLAEDIVSPKDLPEFDVSLVDGYAISECDSLLFKLVSKPSLNLCETSYVETGQPVPEGAVAVVPVESARVSGGGIVIPRVYERGHEIARRGSDFLRGDVVGSRGQLVTPPLARALLSLGVKRVRIHRRPRILVIPTGSEFVNREGRVESSGLLVKAMCEAVGGVVSLAEPVEDSVETISGVLRGGVERYDVVVTIGGVSLGRRDLTVSAAISLPGGALLVRGVAVQPGRATSLARIRGKPVVLLPGLPQSTISGTVFLLQPLIKRLQGSSPRAHYPIGLYRLTSDYEYRGRFSSFTRVRFVRITDEEKLEVELVETPSYSIKTVLSSRGFAILAKGVTSLTRGSYITVYRALGLFSEGL
ncbi:MAG: molybdopterin molybdotransferase MoeA [Sulfolobales archaeon]|nr:molybdopterin molybdotransferase MoeA [Sulfolobales archaeon]MDW8083013.1 molybdopterin molybdotransferase MoeA [Sulfolobales archaeon]